MMKKNRNDVDLGLLKIDNGLSIKIVYKMNFFERLKFVLKREQSQGFIIDKNDENAQVIKEIVVESLDNYDYINPTHYVQDDGRQTWERMIDDEDIGLLGTAYFCKGSAFKYRDRMGKKPNESVERELKKIKWYDNKGRELYEQYINDNNIKNG